MESNARFTRTLDFFRALPRCWKHTAPSRSAALLLLAARVMGLYAAAVLMPHDAYAGQSLRLSGGTTANVGLTSSTTSLIASSTSSTAIPQSLQLTPGFTATANLPDVHPFMQADTRTASMTWEFRVHNWTTPPGSAYLWLMYITLFHCIIDQVGVLACRNFYDYQYDNTSAVSIAGRTDFVVRLVRDTVNMKFQVHVANIDGTNPADGEARDILSLGWYHQEARLSSFTFGDTNLSAQLAYFRWRLGAVNGPMPKETDPVADLADWEFSGNGSDSSANRVALTDSTSAAQYPATPVYAPACNAGPQQIFRVGSAGTLDGSASISFASNPTLQYVWQQLSGPSTATVSNPNLANPSIGGLAFGSYVFQLKVTDSNGMSSTCTVKHGAVAVNSAGSVIIPNTDHAKLVGNIAPFGNGMWPYYDDRHKKLAGLIISQFSTKWQDFWNIAAPGTITVTSGSPTVVGTGTKFQTTFCGGPGNTAPTSTAGIIVWYPSLLYPGTFGRRVYEVSACNSDTQLTLRMNYVTNAYVAAGSGLNYSFSSDQMMGPYAYLPYPGNYYDDVLALYSMYYRSGIDDYLLAARTLADRWWTWVYINRGENYDGNSGKWEVPGFRSWNLLGLYMRALDGRADMWPGLRIMTDRAIGASIFGEGDWRNVDAPLPVSDLRENGYQLLFTALCGYFDPDTTHRSQCVSRLSSAMNKRWVPFHQRDGSWLMSSGNPGSVYGTNQIYTGTASVTTGNMYVTGVGTNFTVLDNNGVGCTPGNYIWFTTAKSMWNATGGNSGDTQAYLIQALNGDTSITLARPYQGWVGNKGYQCGGLVGPGVQPFMLGITATGMRWTYEALAKSGTDSTNAAKARQFAIGIGTWMRTKGYQATTKGLYYGRTFANCEPANDSDGACSSGGNVLVARALSGEAINALAISYALQPDVDIKTAADAMMSAMYSKPGMGGLAGDGVYLSDLEDNGYMYVGNASHKWLGMYFGIGANWAWPAVRLQ